MSMTINKGVKMRFKVFIPQVFTVVVLIVEIITIIEE